MCFMHMFPTELKQIIYYLSSDAFSYIISTHFLHAEYICCMQNAFAACKTLAWLFDQHLLSKDYAILV